MGYRQDGDLADLFDDEPIIAFTRRVAERVQERLLELVTEFTPVAPPDPDRDRKPGTLRDSWEKGSITFDGRRFEIEVFTMDPVGPHVEYPTRPHIIRPRPERGPGAMLRFRVDGNVVYAKEVHHPGTKGSFMMTRALDQIQNEWLAIAHEELAREAAVR